ncbi:MAG: TetR/AcrR family transcriptional regulator [Coriobacteriales bacterium]|nr:TetR/AcrR family transcriptional regulator [Coriobacteriales bacterium]
MVKLFEKSGNDETKMKILHAIDRSLQDMTVDEISSKAGISRQTFYRNFTSKYDIFTWHAIRVEKLYLDEVGRTIDWETGYHHHFRLLAQEHVNYYAGLQYTYGVPFGIDPMPAHRRQVLIETIKDFRKAELSPKIEFCVDAFAKLETELADKWFRDGLAEPECFAEHMASMVPHLLYKITRIK